jgi:hypothetical protein
MRIGRVTAYPLWGIYPICFGPGTSAGLEERQLNAGRVANQYFRVETADVTLAIHHEDALGRIRFAPE